MKTYKIWKNSWFLEKMTGTFEEVVARCDVLSNSNPGDWITASEEGYNRIVLYKQCKDENVREVEGEDDLSFVMNHFREIASGEIGSIDWRC